MDILQAIIKNPAFWAAVVVLINAILNFVLPELPREIRTAIDSILVIVLSVIAGAQITRVVRVERAAKKAKLERIDVNAGTKTKPQAE